MQASYRQGDFIPRISQTYEDDSSLAWRQGKLVLDDLALSDALPLINRYLDKPLVVADNSTGSIHIGGIYNIKEINSLVKSLPRVLPVYLTRNDNGNLVVNAIPQKTPKS
jgi:transmembrane sensor